MNSINNLIEKNKTLVLVLLIVMFVFVRFFISLIFTQSMVTSDEIIYKNMAYSFFENRNLYFYNELSMGRTTDIPNFLYQIIMSFSFYFNNNFMAIVKFLNSLILCISIIPIYLMVKSYIHNNIHVFILLFMILLMPQFYYSIHFMPENLYFMLFFWSIYFTLQSVQIENTGHIWHSFMTGILFALLYLTKPNALAIFIAVALYFIVLYLTAVRFENTKIVRSLLRLRGLIILISCLGSLYILNYLFSHRSIFDLGYYSPSHIKVMFGVKFQLIGFLKMIFGHLSVIFTQYSLPILFMLYGLFKSYRDKKQNLFIIHLLFTLVSLVVMAMVFKFTNDIAPMEKYGRLHERYYYFLYPLFLISFFVFIQTKEIVNKVYLGIGVIITLSLAAFTIFEFKSTFINPMLWVCVDNLSIYWILGYLKGVNIYLGLVILSVVVSMMILYNKKYMLYIMVLFLFYGVSNYGTYKMLLPYDRAIYSITNSFLPMASWITSKVDSPYIQVFDRIGHSYQLSFWKNFNHIKYDSNYRHNMVNENNISKETNLVFLFGEIKPLFKYTHVYESPYVKVYEIKRAEQ